MEEAEHAPLLFDDGLFFKKQAGDGIIFDLIGPQQQDNDCE